MTEDWLLRRFPRLGDGGFRITSPRTTAYNCIGWAAEDDSRWWSPEEFELYYWPTGAPRGETVEAWAAAFSNLGFEACADAEYESGYARIAIYGRSGAALHVARQLASGRWTSKLGASEDIEHDLVGLTGDTYGEIVLVMRRPLQRS